eukprot:525140-Amphidinium_carterae.1
MLYYIATKDRHTYPVVFPPNNQRLAETKGAQQMNLVYVAIWAPRANWLLKVLLAQELTGS